MAPKSTSKPLTFGKFEAWTLSAEESLTTRSARPAFSWL